LEGRQISQLSQAELANVESIAINNEEIAGTQAKGIIEMYYDNGIVSCPDIDDNVTWKNSSIDDALLAKALGIEVSTNPNPAKEWIAIHYKLPTKESSADLLIFDSKSNLIERIKISGQQGEHIWNCSNFSSGVYYYVLSSGQITLSDKMIIIH